MKKESEQAIHHIENDIIEKKKKDQFGVIIVGLILYSVILIAIVVATYLGIKAVYKSKVNTLEEAKSQTEEELEVLDLTNNEEPVVEAEEEAVVKEEEAPVEEEDEDSFTEHTAQTEEFLNVEEAFVDYSQEIFSPEKRDTTLTWKNNVFSNIENVKEPKDALVNTYNFTRKTAKCEDDSKIIYEIYTNPETSHMEKITTIRDCSDNKEITDYYYSNGNVNYVAYYTSYTGKPVDISSSDVQSRYYYQKDTLVKYSYCENGKATEYVVSDLDSYSEGTLEQYNYLEKSMLNRAYITYNAAKYLKATEVIEGYVFDELGIGQPDAEVMLYSDSGNICVAKTMTDGDGHYSLTVPVNDEDTYTMSVNKSTFTECKVFGITADSGNLSYQIEPIYLGYTELEAVYNVQIMVRDATDINQPIIEGSVKIRNGINNRDGDVIAVATLDETGAVTAPLKAGQYTIEVQKGGYETSYFTALVKIDRQAVMGYAVKDIPQEQYVAVLTWETPALDLDCIAISSGVKTVKKPSCDSVGSMIAEVTEIGDVGSDKFDYYVYDYSNCKGSDVMSGSMSNSNAVVTLFNSDGMIGNYRVPAGYCGVVWKPFEIRNNRVIVTNSYYCAIEQNSYWTTK